MQIFHPQQAQILSFGIFICFFASICSLPLDAIALRNIGLAVGAALSLVAVFTFLRLNAFNGFLNLGNLALFSLLLWVLCRFIFISSEPNRELNEIQSLWLRSFLAGILGTVLGLMSRQSNALRLAILLTLMLSPLIIYYLGFFNSHELAHTPFDGFYKSKAAVSYFLLFPLLISFASIQYLLTKTINFKKIVWLSIFFWILCIGSALGSLFGFYYSKSLNGLLVGAIFILMLALVLISGYGELKLSRRMALLLSISLIALSSGSLFLYSKDDSKLKNIIQDAYLGTQIDRYSNWQNPVDKPWVPAAQDGHQVNQSTYYRVANFLNGARLIEEHPLGVGFTYLPYGYLMKARYPDSQVTHSHSGWVDFTLGQGIPGVLLAWLAIISTLIIGLRALRSQAGKDSVSKLWGGATVWVMGGIFIAWIVNEVSEREYIEHLFLVITLFAAGNTPARKIKRGQP